ncbi:MAG: hypothetical protein KAJ33_03940 [Thermoplasmata archaeon]|nr:hypothetical protein [Thermoplasmata archaeon]
MKKPLIGKILFIVLTSIFLFQFSSLSFANPDSNNTKATATEIGIDVPTTFSVNSTDDPQDWIKCYFSQSGEIRTQVSPMLGIDEAHLIWWLRVPEGDPGTTLDTATIATQEYSDWFNITPGWYYVQTDYSLGPADNDYYKVTFFFRASDTIPPTPNPTTWVTEPAAATETSIEMLATPSFDSQNPPVQYYFTFVSGPSGGTSSGWQSSNFYEDTGLQPNSSYLYTVRSRDNIGNETSSSIQRSAYTYAATPPAPTVNTPTQTTLNVKPNLGSNTLSTEMAIKNVTTGHYINASGNDNGTTEVWQTYTQWGTVTVNGLTAGTTYEFQVKARNGDYHQTGFGIGASGTTEDQSPPLALSSDISNQPAKMYPGTQYSITSRYYDPDGRTNLKYCYLQLHRLTGNTLTLQWNQAEGTYYPWAGSDGADYLTLNNVQVNNISSTHEGYEITWSFTLNSNWQETASGINFGVYAEDDDGLADGWNYDSSSSSFSLGIDYTVNVLWWDDTSNGILGDGIGENKPLRWALVKLYDDDLVVDDYLGEGVLDANGSYTFNNVISGDPNGPDLYIKIIMDCSVVGFLDFGLADLYTTPTEDVTESITVTHIMDHEEQSTYAYVFNTIQDLHQSWENMTGYDIPRATVYIADEWLSIIDLEARYMTDPVNLTDYSQILIGHNDDHSKSRAWNKFTIAHEYGHHIMYKVYGNMWPVGAVGANHQVMFETDSAFALVEGWAEFMQNLMYSDDWQNDYNNTYFPLTFIAPDEWGVWHSFSNIENNNWWMGQDIDKEDGEFVNPNGNSGEIVEGAIASILWDIFDADNSDESLGGIENGIQKIWNVMQIAPHPNNINDFWDRYIVLYPNDKQPLWEIYSKSGINKDSTAPTGSIVINSGDSETDSVQVVVDLSTNDDLSGVDPAGEMRFSNDNGTTWSPWETYASTKANYSLTDFGGNSDPEVKQVSVQFKDAAGNSSSTYSDSITYILLIVPTGTLTVTITPPEAVTQVAQWRVEGTWDW